jgi:hypothetical protein
MVLFPVPFGPTTVSVFDPVERGVGIEKFPLALTVPVAITTPLALTIEITCPGVPVPTTGIVVPVVVVPELGPVTTGTDHIFTEPVPVVSHIQIAGTISTLQVAHISNWQVEEHPSPFTVFASSHISPLVIVPFPQLLVIGVAVAHVPPQIPVRGSALHETVVGVSSELNIA